MSENKKWTRRAAIGFISGGAGLLALRTDAAIQIQADRGVNLGTTTDTEALLPLIDESISAEISGFGDETTVYRIAENNVNWDFTDVSLSNIKTESGDDISRGNSPITVSTSGEDVVISCSGSTFSGKYELSFDLKAESEGGQVSVVTDRTAGEPVPIDCTVDADYADVNNYSDNGEGDAEQPGDKARGTVEYPSNIGNNDENFATLNSRNKDGGLKVGFVLPPVSSAEKYVLTVRTKKATGGLVAYIVTGDEDGDEVRLSCNKEIKKNTDEYVIQATNKCAAAGEKISDEKNRNDLFLVFEDGSNGNNRSEIRFIDFQAHES